MKKTFYKVSLAGDKNYCVIEKKEIGATVYDWLSNMDDNEYLKISKTQMTQEKFDDLPEPEYEG